MRCSRRLRTVLNNFELELLPEPLQPFSIERMSVEMHGNKIGDIASLTQQIVAAREIDQSLLVGVDVDGDGSKAHDRERRGEGRERGREHALPWPAAERPQSDFYGIHAIGGANNVLESPIRSEVFFETFHFFAEDVPAAMPDALNGSSN